MFEPTPIRPTVRVVIRNGPRAALRGDPAPSRKGAPVCLGALRRETP